MASDADKKFVMYQKKAGGHRIFASSNAQRYHRPFDDSVGRHIAMIEIPLMKVETSKTVPTGHRGAELLPAPSVSNPFGLDRFPSVRLISAVATCGQTGST
jgi:hypothetical protein